MEPSFYNSPDTFDKSAIQSNITSDYKGIDEWLLML
jgi:hypothetical protein